MARVILLVSLWLATCFAQAASYELQYLLSFDTEQKAARVEMVVGNHSGKVRRLSLKMPESKYRDISFDGEATRDGDQLTWVPPATGGELRFSYRIEHERRPGAYDALMTNSWVIMRGDDVFPAARVRTKGKLESRTTLSLKLPSGWHADTPYPKTSERGYRYSVNWPKRRFDRPIGWMIAGRVGARRDFVGGTEVAVAAPKGEEFRRQDVLAFLSYNLPHMARAFGTMPDKLLIVGGPDPMWRGGLSAPNSLFLHADRPLISENATSPMLHELTHVITRVRGGANSDWMAEGLAEYYGIEIMRRSGGISERRFKRSLNWLKKWSKDVKDLTVKRSKARITARSVLLIHALDQEIQTASGGKRNIDDVTRRLMKIGKVTTKQFVAVAEEVLGGPSKVLATPLLD